MRSPTTRYFPLLSKRASMGIAARVSSIDRSLVLVPALAPPHDSFAATEKRCNISTEGIGAHLSTNVSLLIWMCLQHDARFGGQCVNAMNDTDIVCGWGLISHTVDLLRTCSGCGFPSQKPRPKLVSNGQTFKVGTLGVDWWDRCQASVKRIEKQLRTPKIKKANQNNIKNTVGNGCVWLWLCFRHQPIQKKTTDLS